MKGIFKKFIEKISILREKIYMQNSIFFSLITTKIGTIGIAWQKEGLQQLLLPDKDKKTTRIKILEKFPLAKEIFVGTASEAKKLPSWLVQLEKSLQDYADGKLIRFPDTPFILDGVPDFHRKIWQLAKKIPRGKVYTYGELAKKVGSPGAARAVGQAMAKNRFPLLVPCHRVMGAGKKLCGFSAYRGTDLKAELLAMEGYSI